MSRHEGLSAWTLTVSNHMPHLSKPQVTVLAMWSYGIAITRSCGRTTVATFLALLLQQKATTMEQRLREWGYDATDKRGIHRRELDVTTCFAPLLIWIVSLWTTTSIALALDATSLGDRFVALTVSVVIRGCAIPVAWSICQAQQKGSWRRVWLRLLRQLRPAIPADWVVLVLTDRGLYGRWLFRRIVRLGWHPFMRINRAAKFQPSGQPRWFWLSELVGQVGATWYGRGIAFKSSSSGRLACVLIAWWGEGHDEPWFILTDLPPEACQASWYGLRAWCEQGFKCTKRGGWQWQYTRMSDPTRAARLWLALAIATLWVVSVGSDLEVGPSAEQTELPDLRSILGIAAHRARPRRTRTFRLGCLWLLVQHITHHCLPMPQRLAPEPWPELPAPSAFYLIPRQETSHVPI